MHYNELYELYLIQLFLCIKSKWKVFFSWISSFKKIINKNEYKMKGLKENEKEDWKWKRSGWKRITKTIVKLSVLNNCNEKC